MIDVQIGKHSEIDFVGQVKWMNEMLVSFLHLNGIKRRDPSGKDVKHLKTWSVFTLDVTWHGGGLLLARFTPPIIFFFCHFVQCLLRKNGCDGWFWQVVFPVTFENSLISACYQNTRFMTWCASSWTFLYFYPTRNDNSKKLQKHLEHRSFTQHFPLAICNAG